MRIGIAHIRRKPLDRPHCQVGFVAADFRGAGIDRFEIVAEGRTRGNVKVEVELRVLAVHDIGSDVQAHLAIQEFGLGADFIGIRFFRAKRCSAREQARKLTTND